MKLIPTVISVVAISVFATTASRADVVSLATLMNGDSYISETQATGSFAQIKQGNGNLGSVGAHTGDADGAYNINHLGQENPQLWGTPIDFFPREANFLVGSISFNSSGLTGIGIETTQVTGLDMSEFWKPDPNRTNSTAGNPPLAISDISDHAIGLWFFGGGGGVSFGGLDASDTITFTDGVLTRIDLETTTVFDLGGFGIQMDFSGTFSIVGDQFSYFIQDTKDIAPGLPTTFTADLTGVVSAVGNYQLTAVPEPGSIALLTIGVAGASWRRLRQRKVSAENLIETAVGI